MTLTLGMLAQAGIALFGLSAVWLSQDPRHGVRRWAPIMGMLGQPFWFYTTITAEQWGIAILCGFYTYSWARGFYHQWIGPSRFKTSSR